MVQRVLGDPQIAKPQRLRALRHRAHRATPIGSGERCGNDMPNEMRSFSAMLRAFPQCAGTAPFGMRGRSSASGQMIRPSMPNSQKMSI